MLAELFARIQVETLEEDSTNVSAEISVWIAIQFYVSQIFKRLIWTTNQSKEFSNQITIWNLALDISNQTKAVFTEIRPSKDPKNP